MKSLRGDLVQYKKNKKTSTTMRRNDCYKNKQGWSFLMWPSELNSKCVIVSSWRIQTHLEKWFRKQDSSFRYILTPTSKIIRFRDFSVEVKPGRWWGRLRHFRKFGLSTWSASARRRPENVDLVEIWKIPASGLIIKQDNYKARPR